MAFALYLATTIFVIALWNRRVQRVPVAMALALIALPLLFTGRAILTGRTYAPADLAFMAEPLRDHAREFGVERPYNIALSDLHCQILPWQNAVRYALAHGEWPLWNPFILCGDILAAAAQPAVYDPLQLLGLVLPLADAFTFGATMTFFLAAFFTWAFARELGRGELAALVAATGFTFCGMMAFFVGWPLGRAWAYLPMVLFATRRVVVLVDRRRPAGWLGGVPAAERRDGARPAGGDAGSPLVLLTLALVLTIFAGHPESVLHVVAVGVAYGVFELCCPSPRFAGRGWRGAPGEGTRDEQGTTPHPNPLPTAMKPAAGRGDMIKPILSALLAGVLALLLTAVYLLPFLEAVPQTVEHVVRGQLYKQESYDRLAPPDVRAQRIARTFVPGYRKGNDPLSARVGSAVLILALLGLALNARKRETWFFTLLALVGLGATFGTWPVAHALHALPLFDIAINERLAFAAAFALSMLAAMAVDRMGRRTALAVLALVLVQRVLDDGAIYPALARKTFYPRVPLLANIPKDARMAGLWFAFTPNDSAMYGLEDARGYEAMTNKRLADTYPLWSNFQTAWFNRIDDLSKPFLSFLNVRYVIARTDPPQGWRVAAEDRGTRVLENMRVLPRAFVPRRVRYVRDGENTVNAMKSVTDFSGLAWIEAAELEPHEVTNGPGTLILRRSGLGYLIDAEMEQPGWIVISATAWKGWRASIDGNRVATHFANHAFLGVYVPQGSHRVSLEYRPSSFTRGRNVSLATLLVLVCYKARRIAVGSRQ